MSISLLISYFAALILLINCDKIDDMKNLNKIADEIHKEIISIDTHTDTPLRLVRSDFDINAEHKSDEGGGKFDLPRMVKGRLDAVFFAVFTGQAARDPLSNKRVKEKADEILDAIYRSVENSKGAAKLAFSADDIVSNKNAGVRTILIGMENGYPIGRDLNLVAYFFDRGVRYVTLCHTKNNDICDSSNDEKGAEHNGLSPFGKRVVAEMNRLGMIIDVSHISDKAFFDVISLSKSPVIASHSSARALCDNPRNLTDEMIGKIRDNNGVVSLVLFTDYIKTFSQNSERERAIKAVESKFKNYYELSEEEQFRARTEIDSVRRMYPRKLAHLTDYVDHIEHVIKTAGIDHVGIGSDFDGGGGINGCYDVGEMKNITIELLKRGYNKEEIKKIWGGNFLRVFKDVENVSKEMNTEKQF